MILGKEKIYGQYKYFYGRLKKTKNAYPELNQRRDSH